MSQDPHEMPRTDIGRAERPRSTSVPGPELTIQLVVVQVSGGRQHDERGYGRDIDRPVDGH
jgi:hypothetical protein